MREQTFNILSNECDQDREFFVNFDKAKVSGLEITLFKIYKSHIIQVDLKVTIEYELNINTNYNTCLMILNIILNIIYFTYKDQSRQYHRERSVMT